MTEGRALDNAIVIEVHCHGQKSGRRSPGLAAIMVMGFGLAASLSLIANTGKAWAQDSNSFNDYPTEARADYIFGCMAANGETQTMLYKCSCSIDRIASILSYDDYVKAETVLSMRQVGGERMSMFKSSGTTDTMVADLRRAQAEAEMLCF